MRPPLSTARTRALGALVVISTAVTAVLTAVLTAAPADAGPGAVHRAAAAPVVTSRTAPAAAAAKPFPTKRTTGVPPGWQPRRTVTGRDLEITTPGAVVQDVRVVDGDVLVNAPDVTLRRVEVEGGVIDNYRTDTCYSGMKLVRVTVRRAPGQVTEGDFPAIGAGGYKARRVAVLGLPEGFRVGGHPQCAGVSIHASLAKVVSPDVCGDWHGDGLQGYGGGALTLRNTSLRLVERNGCYGTAPFFYPEDQDNTSADIDGLLVQGGGFPFRLGTAGSVEDLVIARGSWGYGPTDVDCGLLSQWQASVATVHGGQPHDRTPLRCHSD
jgi:hypothetical protein